jgi:hypothetical protein
MHKHYFLSSLILLSVLLCPKASSRIDYVGLMIKGDFDKVVKNFEEEKDLKKLFSDEGIILIHTLVMDGKVLDSKAYVDYYYKRFPKEHEYLELKRKIDIFTGNLDQDIFSENQKRHIEFTKMNYTELEDKSSLKESLLREILALENEFYLSSKYDYAFALNRIDFFDEIEKEALREISSKRKILFPKTLDFFQLAMAYKALAVIKIHKKELDQAKRFIKLAQNNVLKMRSIWLIEDLNIYNPIMKTEKKSTRFASLYPQYLIKLRDEFSSFLI